MKHFKWIRFGEFHENENSQKKVNFTKSEISKIEDTFKNIINDNYVTVLYSNDILSISFRIEISYWIKVIKLQDEWFYIKVNSPSSIVQSCYKCDQLEGLINCIKKLLNKWTDLRK